MTEVYITFEDFPDNIIPHLYIRKSGKEYRLMETKDFEDCDTLQEWLANMAKTIQFIKRIYSQNRNSLPDLLDKHSKFGQMSMPILQNRKELFVHGNANSPFCS